MKIRCHKYYKSQENFTKKTHSYKLCKVVGLLLELGGPNMFQNNKIPVDKARTIKTWLSKADVEELQCHAQGFDLNPNEPLG